MKSASAILRVDRSCWTTTRPPPRIRKTFLRIPPPSNRPWRNSVTCPASTEAGGCGQQFSLPRTDTATMRWRVRLTGDHQQSAVSGKVHVAQDRSLATGVHWHDQRSPGSPPAPGPGMPRRRECRGAFFQSWCSSVIIVSEPSAEAARRARTGRSSPARSRSSAATNDTLHYAMHGQSAFTQKTTIALRSTISRLRRASAPGWSQGWKRRW